jgi:hypothetical protein
VTEESNSAVEGLEDFDLSDLEDIDSEEAGMDSGIEELDLTELETAAETEEPVEELELSDLEAADENEDNSVEPEELIEELEDFDLGSLEEEEPETEVEELDLSDLESLDESVTAEDEDLEDLEEFDLADFEEDDNEAASLESEIDFEDLESLETEEGSEVDFDGQDLTVADESEDLLVERDDIIPMHKDSVSEETDFYSASDDEPEVSEPAETMPIDIELPEMQETEKADMSEEIPSQLRDEIKSVLSYMDHLLESLPEDKIEEFANSEHFNVYKRLFSELGLNS